MTNDKAKRFANDLRKLVEKYNAELTMYNYDLTAELVLADVDGSVTLVRLNESKDDFVTTFDILDNLDNLDSDYEIDSE